MSENQLRTKEQIDGIVGDASTGASIILSATGRLARIVWNAQMKVLIAINAMSIFRKHWWLFLVVWLLLTAFVLPIGVVWSAIAYFALKNEPKAEDDYIVEVDSWSAGAAELVVLMANPDAVNILRAVNDAGETGIPLAELYSLIGSERARVRRLTTELLFRGLIIFSAHKDKRYIVTDEGKSILEDGFH